MTKIVASGILSTHTHPPSQHPAPYPPTTTPVVGVGFGPILPAASLIFWVSMSAAATANSWDNNQLYSSTAADLLNIHMSGRCSYKTTHPTRAVQLYNTPMLQNAQRQFKKCRGYKMPNAVQHRLLTMTMVQNIN